MLTQINTTLLGFKGVPNLLPKHIKSPQISSNSFLTLEVKEFDLNMMNSGPIMASMGAEFNSMNLVNDLPNEKYESVHLLDDQEQLLVKTEKDFLQCLEIAEKDKVKVVAIFGNTGEGKSYTLNHTFFNGQDIFPTSSSQTSCTIGVWAKYEPQLKMICLDTEGLLGISKKEHQRTRLLMKILAISDVIIFRTKAERLPRDMYTFLGGASRAYKEHFSSAFQAIFKKYDIEKPVPAFGPSLIIFQETRYTETLKTNASVNKSPEDIIRDNFTELNETFDGFNSIKYIGNKNPDGRSRFNELKVAVECELESTKVRSARDPRYIFLTLKGLNEKYQRQISETPQLYLSAFFTCQDKCLSCGEGCTLSMGHKDDDVPHANHKPCVLQHQYQNFAYLCRKCNENGIEQVVHASYHSKTEQFWSSIISTVWSGYIIECPKCGKIYQSREYWYGNKDPKDEAVLIKIVHVWPGDKHYFQQKSMLGSSNSAQKVLDGVTNLTNVVASVGSQPTKMMCDWVTDQIAPGYWVPNHEIVDCFKCKQALTNSMKHHCRACGRGFCEGCSAKTRPVPERGWTESVRVCDDCFVSPAAVDAKTDETTGVRYRKMGENVISVVKTAFEIPKEAIKDSVRPTYWTPDSECVRCIVCSTPFGLMCRLHHCRDCGKGVCDTCSNTRKPVPLRGWDSPVRVCNHCSSN